MQRSDVWFIRRGRDMHTRTVALPLWSRFFVPCTVLQALLLIGANTVLSILVEDCLTTLVLALSSLTVLFMCYFAIEAVRTENKHQCVRLAPF